MRDRRGGTPRGNIETQVPAPFQDEDDAEVSKDGDTRASSSWQSTGSTPQQPYQKLLHFLHGSDGITRFLADMCCDTSDFREPQTHELRRHRRHRGLSPDITDGANGIRKTYSSGKLNRKKTSLRSQTAPRQRTSSDFYSVSGMAESPRAAQASLADHRSTSLSDVRSRQRNSQHDRRTVMGSSEQFSRSALNAASRGDLPPLPRQRAKSTASRRKHGPVP